MLLFDIDGVIVSDLDWSEVKDENLDHVDFMYKTMEMLKPNFIPLCEYHLLTARRVKYKQQTLDWSAKHLTRNPPKSIYHENDDYQNPHVYKIQVLKDLLNTSNEPIIFVESDVGIINKCYAELPQVQYYHYHSINSLTFTDGKALTTVIDKSI